MRLTKILFLGLFMLSTSGALVAQGPKPVATSGKAAIRTIDIIGNDEMQYSVKTITASPGEQIRIRMISRGVLPKVAMAHNVVVLQPGTDITRFLNAGAPHRDTDFVAPQFKQQVIAQTPMAGPGETVQVVFTVPAKPGRYPYICTFAGHYMAGMQGVLIVK
ncbi:MAG TPA: plastocyanin/azurin family copper-binding protein [Vicinamibacterales bacterium]|nr:plastocyanin/azurin family copper-binding protein [Vicinamibacterales bacterium]